MTTAPTAPAQTKHKRRKRQGFLTLIVISLILFVIFAGAPSAVGTFIGAVMVGAGGMVMVGIRIFQQNAAREVEETREAQEAEAGTKQAGARAPWGSSVATKIVGWVNSPSVPIVGRKKRQASAAEDSKLEQSATDPAKDAQMAEAANVNANRKEGH